MPGGSCRLAGAGSILFLACLLALASSPAHAVPSFVPPGKPFGFNANLAPSGETSPSIPTLEAARAAGASHMRTPISWRAYEFETTETNPVPPSFSKPVGQPTGSGYTDYIDRQYLAITERGMTPVIWIGNAPKWASTFHTCLWNPVDQIDQTKCPRDWNKKPNVLYPALDKLAPWRAFVAAVVHRYPGAVIEGTNEPDVQKTFWLRYHPPMDVITGGQCALATAVRGADGTRTVLGPSMWMMDYAREFLKTLNGRDCYDHFSLHQYGWAELRTGEASAARVNLNTLRGLLAQFNSKRTFWLTETGVSDAVTYNDTAYTKDALTIGEPFASTAFPDFIKFMTNEPDIMGVLVHSVRESSFGETGGSVGFGLLKPDYTVKYPGGGILPRFCFLVLSAGNTHPGCAGMSLPALPDPGPPSFYKEPHLLSGDKPQVGTDMAVLFFERGRPTPSVGVTWQRCNAVGLSCKNVAWQVSVYRVVAADRTNTLRVSVTISNSNGSVTKRTALSPIVG